MAAACCITGPASQVKAKHAALEVRDGHEIVDALRARKSPAEMALLRKAAEISTEGHRAAMLIPEPTKEYEIQAALEGTFLRLGGARPAYGSIVGGGVSDRGILRAGILLPGPIGDEGERNWSMVSSISCRSR